jgi:two-component system, OmpR family, sensor histidine kinase BaeS
MGFKRKLLAALIVANLVLVAVMASLMYWCFHRGFTNYLRQVEREELRPVSNALEQAYKSKGSWSFLKNNVMMWGLFINFLPGGKWEHESPDIVTGKLAQLAEHPEGFRHPRPGNHPPQRALFRYPQPGYIGPDPREKGPEPLPGPPSNTESLNWRLSLLDGEKHHVFGRQTTSKDPLLIPLHSENKVIGWLRVERVRWLEEGLAAQFRATQLLAVLISALIALLISLLVSIPLGRSILKPVSLVIEGVRKITQGNLSHKIQWHNNDEFNKLIKDVNTLSSTLKSNEELRRTMMADISHELRTPLAVLQAEIEAIQDGIRPCDNSRLESLHKGVRGLSRLIDDLFDLSLADSGNLTYQKKQTDIANHLGRCFELYSNLFSKKDIALERDLPESCQVYCDPDRLHQVFSNLLNNSFRYTDSPGKVKMSAKINRSDLTIVLEDSAPGVPDDQLGAIFDRFYRVDRSRSRAHGGSGLGLSLCKTIIEDHSGTILASHSPLGGLAVSITLPLSKKE